MLSSIYIFVRIVTGQVCQDSRSTWPKFWRIQDMSCSEPGSVMLDLVDLFIILKYKKYTFLS